MKVVVSFCVSVCFFSILFYLGWKRRPFEALNALLLMLFPMQPLASACCRGIVTATIITTTPNNASAATMAIIAIDIVVF